MDERERNDKGLDVRRAVLGDAHVDRALAKRSSFNEEFQDLITRYAWGEIWTRPGLPRHTRSLLTLGLMVALNRQDEFKLHLRAAFNNGVTRDEIREVLMHCAIYAGVPAANSAFHWAEDLFAQMDAPGLVRHLGRGDLVIGSPHGLNAGADTAGDVQAMAALFVRAGVPCVVAPDIDAALWSKLAVNCGLNAVSALGQARYARILEVPAACAVVEAAIVETVAVARADGVHLDPQAMIANTWTITTAMPQQSSSTAQDLERGKATEIDALNGFVVRRGAALGVPTPVNATLHALVKLRESQG